MGRITSTDWKIRELDSKLAPRFEVPRIQRSYAWGKVQVADFINDLKTISENDNLEHYFGAFCTTEKDDETELIIDGQQRIATSHLFLKCAQQNGIQDVSLRKQVDDIIENSLVALGKKDQKIFEKIMKDGFEEIKEEDKNSSLCKSYQIIAENITDKVDVDKLVQTLLNRFRLIKINLQYKSFKRTFHLVNNRGMKLSQSDLIKSHLFMDLETDKQFTTTRLDELDTKWTKMSDDIAPHFSPRDEPIDLFIQYVLSIRLDPQKCGPIKKESLYDEFLKKKDPLLSSEEWLLELPRWCDLYMNLLKPPEEFAVPSALGRLNVKTWLHRIKEMKAHNTYPILIAGYIKYFLNDNKKDFYKLVDSCYRFHIRVKTLGDVKVTDYTKFTQKLANKIYANDLELNAAISELVCFIGENKLMAINESIENIKGISAKHCLLLIEECKYGVEKIANELTLEHVLPKKYTSSHWSFYVNQNYDSLDDAKYYVNKLGNMVLLSGRKNSRIQDKPLSEKIQKYKESAYKITQELQEQNSWTQSDIDERCAKYTKYLEHALDITKYPTNVRIN